MMMAAVVSVLTASAQTFETAYQAVRNMKVGWNLGNTLDAHNGSRMTDVVQSETTWGQPVTKPELMQMMKEAGFGAIRVPVTWYPHMDNNNKVDAAWMKRVHEVVDYVLDAGMYCILNIHHDTGADGDGHTSWLKADETVYAQQKGRFESLWRQIAEEFRDYDQRLLFESYNEMLDTYNSWCFASFAAPGNYNATVAKSAYNAINSYAQSFVNTVRATGGNNAQRNLIVNTYAASNGIGNWNSHLLDPLKQMNLPDDVVQGHLFFEVHAYPSIENMSWMRTEVGQMFKDLNTYLAQKGAPVIIGEWGSSTSADYDSNRSNLITFIKYFVEQAKANDFPTFFWMGISDGMFRQLPAFSQPDLAKAILQAYYGSSYEPTLPTLDDFGQITYIVTYHGQWQELNLWDHDASLNDFKAIRVELGEMPRNNVLSIKVYGESDGKEQYSSVSQTSLNTTLNFNRSQLGSKIRRVTLQYSQTGDYTIKVNRAFLIKNDGTEVQTTINPFWGCTMEMQVEKNDNGIHTMAATGSDDGTVYNLSGQRVARPQHGIYIVNGKKMILKQTQ